MSQFLQFNLNLPGNKKKYTWRGFLNSWLSKEHPKVTPCIPPFPYSILCGCYTIWRPLPGTPTLSLRSSSLLSHFHPHPFPSPILHCLFPIFVSLIMPSHLPISFSPTSQLDFHPFFPSFHFHCKPSWRVLLFIFLYVLCTTFLKRKWSFFFLYIQTEIEDCTENPCWQPISWEALISFKTSSKILNCSKSH